MKCHENLSNSAKITAGGGGTDGHEIIILSHVTKCGKFVTNERHKSCLLCFSFFKK